MDRNKPYSLALYEKALPGGREFPWMLAQAAEAGFDRLEISVDETDARLARLDWSDAQKAALVTAQRESGVGITTMCLSGHRKYPLGSADAATRRRSMEIMEKAVDFAAQTGVHVIQLAGYDVYYEPHSERTEQLFAENLRHAAELAARAGVILAFETMETPFMDTVEKAMRYVRAVDSPWLGVYPDIGNLQNAAVLYGHDIVRDLLRGQGHTFAMHLKETVPGKYRDLRFGSGHTPYVRCLQAAKRLGVRMFTAEFWHHPDENFAAELRHSAHFLREKLDSCDSAE